MGFTDWFGSVLFAADVSDALAGSAGWVGSGLLGAVLAWLLFVHLPGKDKILKDLVESKDKLAKDLNDSKDKQLRELAESHDKAFVQAEASRRADFKESLMVVVNHCQREAAVLHGMLQKDLSEMTASTVDLKRVMEEFREAYIATTKGRGTPK